MSFVVVAELPIAILVIEGSGKLYRLTEMHISEQKSGTSQPMRSTFSSWFAIKIDPNLVDFLKSTQPVIYIMTLATRKQEKRSPKRK